MRRSGGQSKLYPPRREISHRAVLFVVTFGSDGGVLVFRCEGLAGTTANEKEEPEVRTWNDELRAQIEALSRAVASKLWLLEDKTRSTPRLRWPTDGKSEPRVSEQEARILFCQELENSRWYYSVETPTQGKFREKGAKKLSARVDLSLYKGIDSEPCVNIEFKCNNPESSGFEHDFEKLLREQPCSVWFGVIVSQARLPRVLESIPAAFARLDTNHKILSPLNREVLFQLCVLESGRQELFQGRLQFDGTLGDSLENINRFFKWESLRLPSGGWKRFAPGGELLH